MSIRVPIRQGLFDEKEGGRLIGNKCASCRRTYFPKARFCFNCFGKDMEDIIMSRRGRLYSYTIGRMASTHFQPPYVVGLIDLPEGVRVFAPLKVKEDQPIKIGMEVELVIDELWKEDDKSIIGYKFKPV